MYRISIWEAENVRLIGKENSIFIIFFHFHWTIHVSLQGRFLGKQLCVFIHIYILLCMYIYFYMCRYTYMCLYLYVHICLYTHAYTCMHICVNIFISKKTHWDNITYLYIIKSFITSLPESGQVYASSYLKIDLFPMVKDFVG